LILGHRDRCGKILDLVAVMATQGSRPRTRPVSPDKNGAVQKARVLVVSPTPRQAGQARCRGLAMKDREKRHRRTAKIDFIKIFGAGEGIRTLDPNLGKGERNHAMSSSFCGGTEFLVSEVPGFSPSLITPGARLLTFTWA
jgi:hypothetical protein